MPNEYCKDYLMHTKGRGFVYNLGEKIYDITHDPNRASKKKMQMRQPNAMENDPRYSKPQVGAMTKDPRYAAPAPKPGMSSGDYNSRFAGSDGKFDKNLYNKWYYKMNPELWAKGGKYYKAAKDAVTRVVNDVKNKQAGKIGERIYDRIHKNDKVYDPYAKQMTYAKNKSLAGVQVGGLNGTKSHVNAATQWDGQPLNNLPGSGNKSQYDWSPKAQQAVAADRKRRADAKFIKSGGVGPTMNRRR